MATSNTPNQQPAPERDSQHAPDSQAAQLAAISPTNPPPLPPDSDLADTVARVQDPDAAADDASRDAATPNDPANASADDTSAIPPGHEFLVPGPNEYSNTGTLRWGLTWILFSVLLIVFMLIMSVICWLIASWTGLG